MYVTKVTQPVDLDPRNWRWGTLPEGLSMDAANEALVVIDKLIASEADDNLDGALIRREDALKEVFEIFGRPSGSR